MALTGGDLLLWSSLAERGLIPATPRVLEIGQANWYGDVPPPPDCQDACRFAVARKWYAKTLGCREVVSVDLHGKDALRFDLNEPLPLPPDNVFDVVINTGTAEHVFDQRQVFQTIHDRCAVGGLMVHAAPMAGWANHGFYVHQPCLFADLARANDYERLYGEAWRYGKSRWGEGEEAVDNVMLYVALRKTRDRPFRVPVQGRYGTNQTTRTGRLP